MLSIESAALKDKGRKKRNNEDYYIYSEPHNLDILKSSGCLYVVADGVTGAAKGEVASRKAAEIILADYYQDAQTDPGERLHQAIRHAGNEIFAYAESEGTRMATTIVAAVVRENILTIAHVGDSRAYLIRNGKVLQLTRDHTEANELVDSGALTPEEAEQSRLRHKLARSVGGEEDVQVDLNTQPLMSGDRVLLCTDGLTEYAGSEDIAQMMVQGTSGEIAGRLINFANQHGGKDNIATIVLSIGQSLDGVQPAMHAPLEDESEDVTLPHTRTTARSMPRKKRPAPFDPRSYVPWLVVGAGLFLVAILLGIWVGRKVLYGNITDPAVLTREAGMTQVAFNNAIPLVINPNKLTATPTVEVKATVTLQPPATMAFTETPTPIATTPVPTNPTATLGTPTQSETGTINKVCVFQANAEFDMLTKIIIVKFGLDYYSFPEYFYYQCDDKNNDGLVCYDRQKIVNNDQITIGWWINIPVEIQSVCESSGGTWARTR